MNTPHDNEVVGWIEQMSADVSDGPEIYRPGAFWSRLVKANVEMIRTEGIQNFKRTVSNNYFNWLVVDVRDLQFRHALARWLRRPRVSTFSTRMQAAAGLRQPHRDDTFALSAPRALVYRFFVSSLWDLARTEDSRALTTRLSEPEVGNPLPLRRNGQLISQDLANSIVEFSFADRAGAVKAGGRVAELGAGYGRLAYAYAETDTSYCIFDIPPALAVSQWYLREVLGPDRVITYNADATFTDVAARLRPGVVAFFTPAQLDLFPDGFFDLTQTISTLPEMPDAQAAHLLSLLLAKSSGALFLKQWLTWRNDADCVELAEEQYLPPAAWRLAERRIDPVQPAFFNQIWRRTCVSQ